MDGGGLPKRYYNLDKRKREEDGGDAFSPVCSAPEPDPTLCVHPLHHPLRQTNGELEVPFIFLTPLLAP